MAASTTPELAPLPLGRRIGFVLVTLLAFGVDALTVVPDPEHRDGQRWTAFDFWDTTLVEFLVDMGIVYAVLLLRRRWPLVVVAWMSLAAVVLALAAPSGVPVVGVLLAVYTAASLLDQRWRAWSALVVALVALCTGLVLTVGMRDAEVWLGLAILAGITFSIWFFGRRERHATLAADALPGRLAEHGELAAAHERRRIARELHDIVAHSVSAMMMQAGGAKAITTALRQDLPDDRRLDTVERALATIENTGSQSMRELHRLLSVLRGGEAETDSPDAESSSQPGMADIAPLVELTRQSGLVVEVHAAGPAVRLDPSVGLAAYRVVQESLTNAMKHAGRGAIVDLFLNWQPDGLQLQVRSRSGHEGTPPGSGLGAGSGLYGLHERVELIGGTFRSGWVGDDFVVTAVLPLTPTVRPALGVVAGAGNGTPALPPVELHRGHASRLDGARAVGPRAVGPRAEAPGAERPRAGGSRPERGAGSGTEGLPPGTALMAVTSPDGGRTGGAGLDSRHLL